MRAYASILLIPVNRFQFCSYRESSFLWKSINMTENSSRKAAGIDEVNTLNLGLRKTKHETTAPQIIAIHRTRSVKNTNIAHWRVSGHRNAPNWDFIHHITAVKTHQHRNTANLHLVPLENNTPNFFLVIFLFPRKVLWLSPLPQWAYALRYGISPIDNEEQKYSLSMYRKASLEIIKAFWENSCTLQRCQDTVIHLF